MDQAKLNGALDRLASTVTGFMGASVVDLDTGMTLVANSTRTDFDLGVASAHNSEMVKQKLKTIEVLNLNTELDDMLLTLGDQLHLIRLLTPETFLYLAADRKQTNLAIMRNAVGKMVEEFR